MALNYSCGNLMNESRTDVSMENLARATITALRITKVLNEWINVIFGTYFQYVQIPCLLVRQCRFNVRNSKPPPGDLVTMSWAGFCAIYFFIPS